ncbi:ATP-binding cassette domain-containing protein [Staphylococcus carnosus]|uniref:ATP-binding cassette domain-containing protein n=1 Tax=Staphylococcus carnosus TaxID=1281 RepID=UPI0020A5BFD0|nr:ATP-binding cassette domain-containing protein [Staphylococcus carnosus]UTB80364.1 teichoic acid ABC transporter ATP-binding protein [Staphylococcus carnosus]UTB85129.1 teichoic acid ABC transporter ATP-binding protein [Staphylococcus carnosus]
MASSIVLKLLNITHYYRRKNRKKWYLPYGYDAEDIELNNVSLYLYQGESLGIIGEPGASKTLIGRILAGEVNPDKGRVNRTGSLFFGDLEDKHLHEETVEAYVQNAVELFTYKGSDHKTEQIIRYAGLNDIKEKAVYQLTDRQYAQLILSLARTSKAEIVVFNHVLHYLDETFLNRAVELADDYIDNELTLITIDDDLDVIRKVSNYAVWISHGQVRMEGALSKVLPAFTEHENDRKSLETDEEKKNFDVDWKKKRTRIPEMTYDFRRIERYKHAKPTPFLARVIGWSIALVLGFIITAALLFTNQGIVQFAQNTEQTKLQSSSKQTFEDKLSYGIVTEKQLDAKAEKGDSTLKIPHYALVTITGENDNKYRIDVDGKDYDTSKGNIRYFNPAGLYETHGKAALEDYMKSNYINYIDFYNSHLGQSKEKAEKSLVPENDNRFVVPITQQPVSMLFNDSKHLTGFVYPMVSKDKFKDKFNVQSDIWICKSGKGYYIADMKNNKWIYIEL